MRAFLLPLGIVVRVAFLSRSHQATFHGSVTVHGMWIDLERIVGLDICRHHGGKAITWMPSMRGGSRVAARAERGQETRKPKPPSGDIMPEKQGQKPGRPKNKRGGQPGHERHLRTSSLRGRQDISQAILQQCDRAGKLPRPLLQLSSPTLEQYSSRETPDIRSIVRIQQNCRQLLQNHVA